MPRCGWLPFVLWVRMQRPCAAGPLSATANPPATASQQTHPPLHCRPHRDDAEARLAALSDQVAQLQGELSEARAAAENAARERDEALAAESQAVEERDAAQAAAARAEEEADAARTARERAETNAQNAMVEAQRCVCVCVQWGAQRARHGKSVCCMCGLCMPLPLHCALGLPRGTGADPHPALNTSNPCTGAMTAPPASCRCWSSERLS